MRIGSSSIPHTTRATPALTIQTCCLQALVHGHGVVRLPHTALHPSIIPALSTIAPLIQERQLRCVVHATLASLEQLRPLFAIWQRILEILDPTAGVIICHLPSLDATTSALCAELPSAIRACLAIEHTHQHLTELIAFAQHQQLGVVFDLLHYEQQCPWPYDAAQAAARCHASWGGRPPLIHVSSQSTHHLTHSSGAHADRLDEAHVITFLRQLVAHAGSCFDIEVEAGQSFVACQHLIQRLHRQAPDLVPHLDAVSMRRNAHDR